MDYKKIDVAIIGSSPLLIILALKIHQSGRSVVLIDKKNTLGGAWSIDALNCADTQLLHEKACHLIEWYYGGYHLIEKLSKISFLKLDPQPMKVWCNGDIELYTSKKSILIDYLRVWIKLSVTVFKLTLSVLKLNKISSKLIFSELLRVVDKLKFDTRYRLLGLFLFDGVCMPDGGYVKFINTLLQQLKSANIDHLNFLVNDIKVDHSGGVKLLLDRGSITATNVVMGESCILGHSEIQSNEQYTHHHLLISIMADDVLVRNSYIHYPDNKYFHRITYVDETIDELNNKISIFLVQLRKPFDGILGFDQAFNALQLRFRISKPRANVRVLKVFSDNYPISIDKSQFAQFKDTRIFILRTFGDLSRNVYQFKNILQKLIK